MNCIPSQSPETRKILAEIAVGPSAIQNSAFYSSLHQKQDESTIHCTKNSGDDQPDTSNFSGSAWNLVHAESFDCGEPVMVEPTIKMKTEDLLKQIQEFTVDISARVQENALIAQGMELF